MTLEQFGERLGWADVREDPQPPLPHSARLFLVVPADASLSPIWFWFNRDATALHQFGSGSWHCHAAPERPIEHAMELARKLVHHELCILEEWDREDRCRSSGPAAPDASHDMIRHDAAYFVRRFFGRAPVREEIDFSRYHKLKHSYIEWTKKAEVEAFWRGQVPGWEE